MEHKKTLYTYIISTTIVLLLVIIGTNLLFFRYDVNQLTSHRLGQLEKNADAWTSRMEIQCSNAHRYMREFFSCSEQLYIQYSEQYPVWEFYEAVTELQEKLNFFTASEEWVEDAGLIFKEKDLIISGTTGLEHWEQTALKHEFDQMDYIQRLCMKRVGNDIYLLDFRESALLKPHYKELSVILYVRMDENAFINSILEYMGSDLERFKITGPDGTEVLDYDKYPDESQKLYHVEREIQGTHNSISFDFDVPQYGEAFQVICGIMILCILTAIICSIWYAMKIKKVVHTPVMKLVQAFKSVESGDYGVDLTGNETEEFVYLYEEIDKVIHQLKKSIEREYEQRLALQESEFKQYQLQINPHFLYNGFYNIQRMCSNGHEEKAAQLSKRMASYYRYITRNGIAFVTLEQEICHMEDYISIQSIRFNNRIRVEYEYDFENPQEIRVPRLIFQPVVENIYEHAFETIEADGEMYVGISVKNNVLTGIIEDSGEGMSQQRIEQINHQLRTDSGYTECTGILNVNKRLKLYYGADSGIHYENGDKLGGARVAIRIELDRRFPERSGSDG